LEHGPRVPRLDEVEHGEDRALPGLLVSRRRRAVAELGHDLKDPLAGARPHIAAAVEDLRGGRRRHPGQPRDIGQGDPLGTTSPWHPGSFPGFETFSKLARLLSRAETATSSL